MPLSFYILTVLLSISLLIKDHIHRKHSLNNFKIFSQQIKVDTRKKKQRIMVVGDEHFVFVCLFVLVPQKLKFVR